MAILGNRNPMHMEKSKLCMVLLCGSKFILFSLQILFSHTHTQKSIPAGFDHTILVYPSYGTCNQTLPAIPNVLEMSVCKLNLKHIHLSIAVANTLLQAMWYTEIKEL